MDRTRELLGRLRWREFGLDLSPRLRVERQFFFPNRAKSRRQIGRLLRNLASDTNQWKPPLMYVSGWMQKKIWGRRSSRLSVSEFHESALL